MAGRFGLNNCIVVVDKASGRPVMRPRLAEAPVSAGPVTPSTVTSPVRFTFAEGVLADLEPVTIVTAASHILAHGMDEEVWSCSSRTGLLQVWSTATYEKVTFGGEWRIDCRGFTSLVHTDGYILGGSNNGSIYTWNPETHWFVKQCQGHTDAVRSLCTISDSMAVSGGSSRDGHIVVWKDLRTDGA